MRPQLYFTDEERKAARRAEYKRDRIKLIARATESKKKRKEREPDLEKMLYQRQLASHPRFTKKRHVREYGLTLEEFDRRVEDQDNRCKICGESETTIKNGKIIDLAIDHDPLFTKKYTRDLLCGRCNSGIGLFKESEDRLRKAIQYLEYWHGVYRK